MRKNIRAGQSVTSGRQTLQSLDESSPCLHIAAYGSRYRVIHDHILIDTIGTPPPPPPAHQTVDGENRGDIWC
jgi:hypothetical protein